MIIELGHFAIILALAMSCCLAVLPTLGVYLQNPVLLRSGGSLAAGMFVFTLVSFICLTLGFVNDDFSIAYVARNSNDALPVYYKISAVWGAHEGSFLLWCLVMSSWTLAVSQFSQQLNDDMRARVLAVLGSLSIGFFLFLIFTSNPFERTLPFFPSEGADLNPLLQDFGLIVHPPLLYVGYVGLSVPFAFAIASLTSGQLDAAWARWSRPWTNVAWAFLTVGITLGSWWAYYELGWGGWWFWDAVENASFMPWLLATALVHSLAATEKRGVFRSWTVLLAISAFSFSLLGAFLVRSGVLTSVHAFAVDPERGVFILYYLVIVIGSSLLLYGLRVGKMRVTVGFGWKSRESFILANNLILTVAVVTVLLGTIYPLMYEWFMSGQKISVGPPYFNIVFVPLMLPLIALMALSSLSRWRKTASTVLLRDQPLRLLISLGMTIFCCLLASTWNLWFLFVSLLCFWLIVNLLADARYRIGRHWFAGLLKQTPSYYGMWMAHIGIALSALGIVTTLTLSEEIDVLMSPGDQQQMSGYEITFQGVTRVMGPNYSADRGAIEISRQGELVEMLYPEKRLYAPSQNVMTEADISVSLWRDVYVALGESIGNQAWSVRVHIKPLVRWIWLGGVLIALGGFTTVLDRRYRNRKVIRARQSKPDPDLHLSAG
ncbi:MAG: heme lyase CcmF/NrfE family subunit [Gammaproteobacteria bacterium]|nr:heme lyase CcmF/NrfE family subunit [Gammaproteobacteria bacterium]